MTCPNPETLAAFAEGKLQRREIPEILAHLETCAACRRALENANEEVVAERQGFRTGQWLAVAAAVALALLTIPIWYALTKRNAPTARLVALSPRSERVAEARLSGGFAWARYRGPARATERATDPQRLELAGAAGELVRRANEEKSAALEHAAGVGLVMIELPLDGVSRLRSATRLNPNDAKAWSDLAAAQYAAAVTLERPSMFAEALASADQALRADANLAEARFNRALILERLGLTEQARTAWNAYLAIDGKSEWATEAREHLGKLPTSTSDDLFKREMPRLEAAVARNDLATVGTIVDRYRQQTRTTAEALTLGEWAQALQRGDPDEAARKLAVARAIGDALFRLSGESLLRDAVRAIDASPNALDEAHAAYLRGRLAYSRHEPAPAERDLRRAAELFATAGDPMAHVARYYAACTRFDQNDIDGARAELATIETSYTALAAQVRWQLALCAMTEDDWQGALPLVTAARDAFVALGEKSNSGFLDALLADTLLALGRPDDGWSARIRSFRVLSAEGRGDRLPVSIDGATRMELRAGNLDVARSIVQIEESINRAANNTTLLTNTLVREAALSAQLGDFATASRQAREAQTIAERIDDAALRARALIDANFALGAASLGSDAQRARTHLTNAIDGYHGIERPLFLPEAHLLRARAELRLGEREAAMRDLDRGIDGMNREHRGMFDAGSELYHEAIRLSLARGDVAKAFAYAERSRSRTATVPELQRQLAGTGAAVLEVVVLDEEVVSFCVTEHDLAVARRPIERARIAELNESELYDLLIRPASQTIHSARQLVIVADPLFDGVSFAALWDSTTRQHLIERVPIAMAPTGRLHIGGENRAPHSLVAVALPSGRAQQTAALPQSREELADIAKLYGTTIELNERDATFASFAERAKHADVIHIAGHTERTPGAGEAVLMFRGERVSWKRVAANTLVSHPVVVLAACETLRRPRSTQTFALSLGDGFLAAGASDVIGTLTPVSDNDAREMFGAFHRHLQSGASAAVALQRAQLDALSAETTHHQRLPWRAIALVTNTIPRI